MLGRLLLLLLRMIVLLLLLLLLIIVVRSRIVHRSGSLVDQLVARRCRRVDVIIRRLLLMQLIGMLLVGCRRLRLLCRRGWFIRSNFSVQLGQEATVRFLGSWT